MYRAIELNRLSTIPLRRILQIILHVVVVVELTQAPEDDPQKR